MQAPAAQSLCRLDELQDGVALGVETRIDGEDASLIVLREGEAVAAYHNVCPHAGRRLDWAPGKFLLKDGVLVCAAHGAAFAAASGLCTDGPCKGEHLVTVAVKVDGEDVVLA
ncbi:Rieske 2Fe-2S domain-containing protein [Oleiagrimonas sp. C23AA]|uniref:Rieske (2Fe-2S) protein n=1 Tax=Oleiagrimonas sp. C23AA TaxID=2719047 RepID=UPI0014222DC3|nr:Rieske 2Fe-2S domain-containing protein [Oleiagrimonas sp. C23AA]NII09835.1 Rieske 2Fe-2S domain-containing protein [Oleiagrimonas sp. C23AA]